MLVGVFSVSVWVVVRTVWVAILMGVFMRLVVLLLFGVQMSGSHVVVVTFLAVASEN